MNNHTFTPDIRNVSDADLAAEIAKRGLKTHQWGDLEPWEPTPPAGFRREIFMQCGEDGYDPCEPYGECEHEQDVCFMGPDVSAKTFGGISSQWTKDKGIFFLLQKHDGPEWNPEQLADLPAAIDTIERKIGEDAAVELLKSQTHLLQPTSTVCQLANFAMDNGVSASAVFAAYQILTTRHEADNAVGK